MMIIKIFCILLVLVQCTARIASKTSAFTKTTSKSASTTVNDTDNMGYNISVITWNLAEKSPIKKDCMFLKSYRKDDIVVLGVQECEDVRPRREEGHRSVNWKALQEASLGKNFTCLAQHRMGGLQIAVYAKKHVAGKVQGLQILDVACGVGNVLTNKGAVCVLLRMNGKTLALINAHLAAHVGKVKERNADYRRIMTTIIDKAHPRWLNKQLKSRTKRASSASSSAREFLDQIWNEKMKRKTKVLKQITLSNRKKFTNNTKNNSNNKNPNVENTRNIGKIGKAEKTGKSGNSRKINRKSDQEIRSEIGREKGRERGRDIGKEKGSDTRRETGRGKGVGSRRSISSSAAGRRKKTKIEVEEELPICPFDGVIFFGDLNYRLELPRLEVEMFKSHCLSRDLASNADALEAILEYDQLGRERMNGRTLQGFSEGQITFLPTFKYNKG
jgi:hypothetical protein